jgi:hypothetical protein
MRKLHVTELSDREIAAVFDAAVEGAVARARSVGMVVPTMAMSTGADDARKPKSTRPIKQISGDPNGHATGTAVKQARPKKLSA